MPAVLLALGAALGWGCSDFLGGLQSRRRPLATVLAVSLPSGLIVLVPLIAIRGDGPPSTLRIAYAVLAGITGVAGISALYRGLSLGTMGVVAPISATAPLVPLGVGLARGERPSPLQLLGIGLGLIGIMAAGREPTEAMRGTRRSGSGSPLEPPRASVSRWSASTRPRPAIPTGRRSSSGWSERHSRSYCSRRSGLRSPDRP